MRFFRFTLILGLLLSLLASVKTYAQFNYDIIANNSNGEMKLTVKDAATNEPMPWVTPSLSRKTLSSTMRPRSKSGKMQCWRTY